jgi:hypothetical protein
MYDTATSQTTASISSTVADTSDRLNWLLQANAQEAQRRLLFRNAQEEEEMLLMRRPLSMRRAYSILGLLLGTLPPAAIFTRIFDYGTRGSDVFPPLLILCVLMNLVCGVVGMKMGSALSDSVKTSERSSWHRMLLTVMLLGMAWGAVTGSAGGLLFFGIGALFGAICAIPVGIMAFLAFTILHRLLARGGMIDARHFWPLACGLTLATTTLILNL